MENFHLLCKCVERKAFKFCVIEQWTSAFICLGLHLLMCLLRYVVDFGSRDDRVMDSAFLMMGRIQAGC